MIPFAKKMDSALNFIDEVFNEEVEQYNHFSKHNDSGEEEMNIEEYRQSLKTKGKYGHHNLDKDGN